MILDEFLIALGVKADTKKVEEFDKAMDGVADSADKTEGAMARAYEATDGFVSGIEGIMGVLGFFTGTLGAAWGIFHGTIMELEDLIKEEKLLTEVTKKQLEQQKKYKESVETLGKRFQSLKVELAFGFLPTMQATIDALDNFLKANKDAIVEGIGSFLDGIASAVSAIGNFLEGLDLAITKTIGWKNTLLLLAGAFLWLKRAAILAFVTTPLGLFLIALTAIILLVDDFMTYMDGGESLFGKYWGAMLKWIGDNREALESIGDGFKAFGRGVLYVLNYLGAAITDFSVGLFAAFQFLVSIFTLNTEYIKLNWKVMVDALLSMFTNLVMIIDPLVRWIADFVVEAWESISASVSKEWEKVTKTFSESWEFTKEELSKAIDNMMKSITSFVDNVSKSVAAVYDAIVQPFSDAFEWVSNKWQGLKGLFSGGINANVNMGDRQAAGVGGVKNSRTINQTNTTNANVIVNGAGNPNLVGSVAANQVNKVAQSNIKPVVWG